MQLQEVKNSIAKIMYNPADIKLLPSDFLLIEDFNQRIVAQILNIYTTNDENNIADVRFALCIDTEENISYYNGYIPSKDSNVMYITSDDITEMISGFGENIYLGNLTYHPKSIVKTPMSLMNDKLYIQCDRGDNTKIIVQNLVSELYVKKRKIILLDFDGRYSRIANVPRIVISESFKFPLNIDAFNNILDYDTVDCPLEDRAIIQGIVLELIDYLRTLENKFLPFTLFKNVVISEFSANPISGLMVLRNKLWQYAQDGLFAESKSDFNIINEVMKNENFVIIDASKIEEKWHKFAIQTIPKIIDKQCYFAFSMNDIPMDKRSIISLYNSQNIIPIVATSYDCPHRNLLKSLSKNQILFKPSKKIDFDEKYASFMSKLSDNDFVFYGETSLNLPLIIDLKPFDLKTSEAISEQEIRRNVDKILSTGKTMLPKEAVITETKEINKVQVNDKPDISPVIHSYEDDDVTDEDLDFIDNIRPDNISIDDLRAQKAEIDAVSSKEYSTFEPLNTKDFVQSQEIQFKNENLYVETSNLPIQNLETENSEVVFNIEQSEPITFKQDLVISESVEQKQAQDDFNFDDLLNENSVSEDNTIQIKEEPHVQPEITIKEEPVIQYKNDDDVIVEENISVQTRNIKNKQQEQIVFKEDKDDLFLDEDIVEQDEANDDIKTSKDNKKSKSEKKQKNAVAGYFKNEAEGMDFIPELPPLDTSSFGGIEYQQDHTYSEEDYDMSENLAMQSVESLAPDEIQGFGFGESDDDFISLDEDEIVEEDEDEEDIDEIIYTSAPAEEKKNEKKILEEDEKALEEVFDDSVLEQSDILDGQIENNVDTDEVEEIQSEKEIVPENSLNTVENNELIDTVDDDFSVQDTKEAIQNIEDEILNEAVEQKKEDIDSLDDELFGDLSYENQQISESVQQINKQEENIEIAENIKSDDLDKEMFELNENNVSVDDNLSLDDDLFTREEIEIKQEEPEIIQPVPAKKKIQNKEKQVKKVDDEIVSIDNIIQNIKNNPQNKIQNKNNVQRKVTKNTPPPPVQAVNNRTQKKVLTVYETDTSTDIVNENTLPFKPGDKVYHPKHGKGVVEGFANYSNKILFCQIEFESVGRRILDPRVSGLEKID